MTLQKTAYELMDASDFLTEKVQEFTDSENIEYLNEYFKEAFDSRRRERAVEMLSKYPDSAAALEKLKSAMDESFELMEREYYAMKLVIDARGYTEYPDVLRDIELSPEDKALPPDEKIALAQKMTKDEEYYAQKKLIRDNMRNSLYELDQLAHRIQSGTSSNLKFDIFIMRLIIIVQVAGILCIIWLLTRIGIKPILKIVDNIKEDNTVPVAGAGEIRYLAETYNEMRAEILKKYAEGVRSHANSMITALSPYYRSIYRINLDTDDGICYRPHSGIKSGLNTGDHFPYKKQFTDYIDDYVAEEYREGFLDFIRPEFIKYSLRNEKLITYRYVVNRNGHESYEMLRIAGADDQVMDGAYEGYIVNAGFTDVDAETRNTLNQSRLLSEALKSAEEANKAKTDFLSNMSHEIRTPINAMLGMNEMILRESLDPDISRYAKDIQTSGQTLLGLVNDLLDFSRIESGKMELIYEDYEVSFLFGNLVNMVSVRAKEKGLELNIDIDENIPCKLFGDSVRIEQCAINLLTNAVKYTHSGSVALRAKYTKTGEDSINMRIEVQDTGIGIKSEDMDKLMSPFERIEENRNRTIEGTGLGLSIVKNLLSMMGTKLEVESTYGSGSVFSFGVDQRVADWKPLGNFSEAYRTSERRTEEYHERFQAPDARILVVDDVKMNLAVVAGLLKRVRIQIDTAESGFEALEKYSAAKYDCIFIDQRMPGIDGVETLHRMKALKENLNRGVPCIALTANAISGVRDMFLSEGFDDYLSKPVEGADLENMLLRYLPEEKIILPEDGGYTSGAGASYAKDGEGGQIGEDREGVQTPFFREFSLIGQIDADQALRYCMNEELLMRTVSDFADAAEDMPDLIEKYASEGDIQNYTIKVHALKSSSKMIGAKELSELAEELEARGDAKDTEAVKAKTPALIEAYRKLRSELNRILGRKKADEVPEAGGAGAEDKREELSLEALGEMYAGLRELVDAFDFDSADDIISAVGGYRLPEGESARFEEIKKLVKGLERDKILELL